MSWHYLALNISLVSSACSCPLPTACVRPKSVHWRAEGEAGKALMLCKHPAATAKTWACYQHCFCHKSKTGPSEPLWRKLTPSQPGPLHQAIWAEIYSSSVWKCFMPAVQEAQQEPASSNWDSNVRLICSHACQFHQSRSAFRYFALFNREGTEGR